MKNYIKYITLCIAATIAISCDDDDANGATFSANAAEVSITPVSISTFDISQTFTINAKSSNDNVVTSVNMFLQGEEVNDLTELGEVNLSNNKGTINLTNTELNLQKADDESIVHLSTNGIESMSTSIKEISMFNPVSSSVAQDKIEAQTTINDTLSYKITTASAVVDRVVIEQKIFVDGEYTEIETPDMGWSTDESSFIFQGEDFNIKDTVYFRVTAFSGSLSANSGDIKVFIDTQRIDGISDNAKLDTITSSYNLKESSLTATPEVMYKDDTFGFEAAVNEINNMKITTPINFVKITSEDAVEIFEEKDLIAANAAYASGTPTTSVSNVETSDVFVYKISRTDKDGKVTKSTGLLSIDIVSVVNGLNSFEFSYAEEVDVIQDEED